MTTSDNDHGARNVPTRESGAPLHAMDDTFPSDLYDSPLTTAVWCYGRMPDAPGVDAAAVRVVRAARHNPDAPITVYRAAPDDTTKISPGDSVSISEEYARQHGRQATDPDRRVVTAVVRAGDLYTTGDLHEWAWDPDPLAAVTNARSPQPGTGTVLVPTADMFTVLHGLLLAAAAELATGSDEVALTLTVAASDLTQAGTRATGNPSPGTHVPVTLLTDAVDLLTRAAARALNGAWNVSPDEAQEAATTTLVAAGTARTAASSTGAAQ